MTLKRTNWALLIFTMLLLVLGSTLMLILMIDYVGSKYTVDKLEEQVEMQSLYYELRMDYYEEQYGIDLDDTPEDFEKFLYDNYRELYDYLVEELE